MVDCGPSRFAVWREVVSENAGCVVHILNEVFRKRGPVKELLLDNSTTFHSHQVAVLCEKWNVWQRFRAAHWPSGNGIIERHYRTIKSLATRAGAPSPLAMVFWYNMAPKEGIDGCTAPCRQVHSFGWRHPALRPVHSQDGHAVFEVGDCVWVKPQDRCCTSRCTRGRITKVTSCNNVEVDGMPRHVLDLRHVINWDEAVDAGDAVDVARHVPEVLDVVNTQVEPAARYPVRERAQPVRYGFHDDTVEYF